MHVGSSAPIALVLSYYMIINTLRIQHTTAYYNSAVSLLRANTGEL